MDNALRELVRRRAGLRCEYCQIHQDDDLLFKFHVDHIIAQQHGGLSDPDNLALACYHCNFHKGTNLVGIDPVTGAIVPLFHPRRQSWVEHFAIARGDVVGFGQTGRATIRVLAMNAEDRVAIRRRTETFRS